MDFQLEMHLFIRVWGFYIAAASAMPNLRAIVTITIMAAMLPPLLICLLAAEYWTLEGYEWVYNYCLGYRTVAVDVDKDSDSETSV